jgi:tRNA wybutosine-synthesizing protein 4
MFYLRSLSASRPAEQPANLSADFPEIANDFELPGSLSPVKATAHSSPLRISGPVAMWLHYDVHSNVLCQIKGRKRLILYQPSDVTRLGFEAGASSSSVDGFSISPEKAGEVHPHEAILDPGEVLFIPELWPHCAAPLDKISVAVNVFFRTLDRGYAPGKDVYGNRDLHAYEKGRKSIESMVKAFSGLPEDVRGFYLGRLAAELAELAEQAVT